jgi:hypothetical protein
MVAIASSVARPPRDSCDASARAPPVRSVRHLLAATLLVAAFLPGSGDRASGRELIQPLRGGGAAASEKRCCQLAINLAGGTYPLKLVLSGRIPQVCANCSAEHQGAAAGPSDAGQPPGPRIVAIEHGVPVTATTAEGDEIAAWRPRTVDGLGDSADGSAGGELPQRKRRRFAGGVFVPEAHAELARSGPEEESDGACAAGAPPSPDAGPGEDGASRAGASAARSRVEQYACALGRMARLLAALDAAASDPGVQQALAPLLPRTKEEADARSLAAWAAARFARAPLVAGPAALRTVGGVWAFGRAGGAAHGAAAGGACTCDDVAAFLAVPQAPRRAAPRPRRPATRGD